MLRGDSDNEAIFCAIHGGSGRMSDYLFENIRVSGRLLRGVEDGFAIDTATVRNVTFPTAARPAGGPP